LKNIRIFSGFIIRGQLTHKELDALVADFKAYKMNRGLPDTFGRDVAYDHPHTLSAVKHEELHHLHLATDPSAWPPHLSQFNRTSDVHLVYCTGLNDADSYALLAILSPDGHEQSFDRDLMLKLAKAAARFRDNH
jgi:mRNA interferase YafO